MFPPPDERAGAGSNCKASQPTGITIIAAALSRSLMSFTEQLLYSADAMLRTAVQVEYFLDGLYCLPYALPGSTFSRALASRDKLLGVLGEELKETHAEFIRKVLQGCRVSLTCSVSWGH